MVRAALEWVLLAAKRRKRRKKRLPPVTQSYCHTVTLFPLTPERSVIVSPCQILESGDPLSFSNHSWPPDSGLLFHRIQWFACPYRFRTRHWTPLILPGPKSNDFDHTNSEAEYVYLVVIQKNGIVLGVFCLQNSVVTHFAETFEGTLIA